MNDLLRLAETVKVDPRLLISPVKQVEIRRGAPNLTSTKQTPSSISNQQIIWNPVLNGGRSTIIDSYMYAEIPMTVTITASGLTGSQTVQNYVADNFAPRQYPLASITSQCTIQVNQQSIQSQPAQYIHALAWNQNFSQSCFQSASPTMPDQSSSYNDLNGSLKNPLLGYASGGDHYSESRGSFLSQFHTTLSNATTWTFDWTLREPLCSPLLEYDPSKSREGLAYIKNFTVTLQFIANISRLFSLDAINCPAVSSINVTLNDALLYMSWLTIPLDQYLPPRTLRSFNTLICNQTQIRTTFTPGQSQTVQSQSYSLTQIPKKVWVYIADKDTDIVSGFTKTDSFLSIQKLTVLFNNRSGTMANMTPLDLYNSCQAEEGSRMTFVQSQHFVGSVLVIDPAKLFGLALDEAPGVQGTFQFQVAVDCTNISNRNVDATLWVTWGNDTILQIASSPDGTAEATLLQGFVKPGDVLASNSLPAYPSSFTETDIYGGNIYDTFRNIWNKIYDFGKPIYDTLHNSKIISKGLSLIPHPLAQAAAVGADTVLGLGRGLAGGPIAGRKTSRADLRRQQQSLRH